MHELIAQAIKAQSSASRDLHTSLILNSGVMFSKIKENNGKLPNRGIDLKKELERMQNNLKEASTDIMELLRNQKVAKEHMDVFAIHEFISKVEMEQCEEELSKAPTLLEKMKIYQHSAPTDQKIFKITKKLHKVKSNKKVRVEELTQRFAKKIKNDEFFDAGRIKFKVPHPRELTTVYPFHSYKKNRHRIIKSANVAYVNQFCQPGPANLNMVGPQRTSHHPDYDDNKLIQFLEEQKKQQQQQQPSPPKQQKRLSQNRVEGEAEEEESPENRPQDNPLLKAWVGDFVNDYGKEQQEIQRLLDKWKSPENCRKYLNEMRETLTKRFEEESRSNSPVIQKKEEEGINYIFPTPVLNPIEKPRKQILKNRLVTQTTDQTTSDIEKFGERSESATKRQDTKDDETNESVRLSRSKVFLLPKSEIKRKEIEEGKPHVHFSEADELINPIIIFEDSHALNNSEMNCKTEMSRTHISDSSRSSRKSSRKSSTTPRKMETEPVESVPGRWAFVMSPEKSREIIQKKREMNVRRFLEKQKVSPNASRVLRAKPPNPNNKEFEESYGQAPVNESMYRPTTSDTLRNTTDTLRGSRLLNHRRYGSSRETRMDAESNKLNLTNTTWNRSSGYHNRASSAFRSKESFISEEERIKEILETGLAVSRDSPFIKKSLSKEAYKQQERFNKIETVLDGMQNLSYVDPHTLQALYQYRKGDLIQQKEEREEEIARYFDINRQLNPEIVKIKRRALQIQLRETMNRKRELRYAKEYN